MSGLSILKESDKRVFSNAKPWNPCWYSWGLLRKSSTTCTEGAGCCIHPTACIWHATFKEELVFMILSCITGKYMVDMSEWLQNSRESQAIMHLWVLCRLPPDSFSKAACWVHSANWNTSQSFQVKNMIPFPFFFFFAKHCLIRLLVESQVKSSLLSSDEFAVSSWLSRLGQTAARALYKICTSGFFCMIKFSYISLPCSAHAFLYLHIINTLSHATVVSSQMYSDAMLNLFEE